MERTLTALLCSLLLHTCVCFQLDRFGRWPNENFEVNLQKLDDRLKAMGNGQPQIAHEVPRQKDDTETIKRLTQAANHLLDANERYAAGFVRLIFHDCVGGCDGCVDTVNNPDNAGLEDKVVAAEKFRAEHAPFWSQADVNAFLGKVAAEKASKNKLQIKFQTGRKDCDRSQGLPFNELPKGQRLDGLEFLQREFGVTQIEAIALIGCHSIGHARKNQSGFDGEWDPTDHTLDNRYFSFMIEPGWFPDKMINSKIRSTQWTKFEDNERYVMLHADMILLKKFHTTGSLDTPSCSFKTCPASPTAYIVQQFAKDEAYFLRVLKGAYEKMINTGLYSLLD